MIQPLHACAWISTNYSDSALAHRCRARQCAYALINRMRLVPCRCRQVYVLASLCVTARRESLHVSSTRTAEQRVALLCGSRQYRLGLAGLGVVPGLATSQISRLRLLPRASENIAFKADDVGEHGLTTRNSKCSGCLNRTTVCRPPTVAEMPTWHRLWSS